MVVEDLSFKVPDKLFAPAESLHISGQYESEPVNMGPDTYVFEGPIDWDATITNTGNALFVDGAAKASVSVACARCLESCEYELDGLIEGYFLVRSDEGEGFEQDEEEEFTVLSDDHIIDLEELIIGALVLELPMLPLCDDDCKGLCPDCGANLNEAECSCKENKPVDPTNPFAALANLTFD